ncbi:hypothetical protein [Galbibacter pacificus]|uniref:LemA family protein n=1 Tax=Galbibacter pacificus TaxID=2996052 RepID=A0ABT6FQ84_9FLAO|nr:hypothetical protein [Galbibacter pacificus]MDG3582111.1 hypothetical protein [Galbibacter pacificus]MDG3585413.1 hypothetical protein [Galbibacter pacificus]
MELKDYLIIGLGLIGWIWGIIQFRLNRKYQKSDRAIDKRFEVYSNFMEKMDQMSANMRSDPNAIYGIQIDLMSEIISGDEERSNNAMIKFNEKLFDLTKNASESLMMVYQELNKLRLVASGKLLPKINEYRTLVQDYMNEYQGALTQMSSSNLNQNTEILQSIGYEKRNERMKVLWQDIEGLMREEIGFYSK